MNGRELWSRKVRINAQANVTTMSITMELVNTPTAIKLTILIMLSYWSS